MYKRILKYFIFPSILISLTQIVNCVSFRIKPIFPKDNYVDLMVTCQKIKEGELLYPEEITSKFNLKESKIFCFVRIKNVNETIKLQWKWYKPDEKLFRISPLLIVNHEMKELEEVTVYDELSISEENSNSLKGKWIVAFFINDVLKGTVQFELIAENNQEKKFKKS